MIEFDIYNMDHREGVAVGEAMGRALSVLPMYSPEAIDIALEVFRFYVPHATDPEEQREREAFALICQALELLKKEDTQ